jgi:hypothetical protein
MITVARDVWLRRRGTSRSGAIGFGVSSVAVIATGLVYVIVPGDVGAAVIGAVIVAGGVYLGVLARRVARAGVMLTTQHVAIRGPGINRSVPLGQVDGFVAVADGGRRGARRLSAGIAMHHSGGERTFLWALSEVTPVWRIEEGVRKWEPTADELNQLLNELKGRLSASASFSP